MALSSLVGGHCAVPSKGEALDVDASPAAVRPVFENEGLQATRRGPNTEAREVRVEHDERLLARLQPIDRLLADLDFCRHRVVTEKEFAGTSRNRSTSSGIDISMTWERLST